MEITILENQLTPEEFTALYTAVGWTPPCKEQVRQALENSLAVFTAVAGNATVGMARLTGDGAMTFLLKDVAVAPEAQGIGVGRLLVSVAEEYVRGSLKCGWAASLELLSAPGKDGFYEKLGFRGGRGTGMLKMIRR